MADFIRKAEVTSISVRQATPTSRGSANIKFRFETSTRRKPVVVSVHAEFIMGQHPILAAMENLRAFAADYDRRFKHHLGEIVGQFSRDD